MKRLKHPVEGMVYACPECDQPDVRGSRCNQCSATFEEPIERRSREGAGGYESRFGMSAVLDKMEADEI